jgi:shikimate kinase
MGLMGSGKTTLGHLLSTRTGWRYFDNDELLVEAFGGDPRELLARRGDEQMHADEAQALKLGLSRDAPCFIGAAAATILDADSRKRLRSGAVVVWLRAEPAILVGRAVGAAHRPFLADDPLAWLTAAAKVRDPLYAAAADVTVDVDERSPAQLADEIVSKLMGLPPCAGVLGATS